MSGMAGYFCNMNNIGMLIFDAPDQFGWAVPEFFEWVFRSKWIIETIQQDHMKHKFQSVYVKLLNRFKAQASGTL